MVAQNMLRTYQVKWVFPRKRLRFDDYFVITKCLQQIEISSLLHMCAPCSELPSNISTLVEAIFCDEKFGNYFCWLLPF